MASRMMHYIIAEKIMEHVPVHDKERFIIGSLIPDASSHSDGSYDAAHFSGTAEHSGRTLKGINWSTFAQKYRTEILVDPLYMGYLCHLIADAVWFCRITDRYVRQKPDRAAYYKLGYEDFRRLNVLLRAEFDLSCPLLTAENIAVDEIQNDRIDAVFQGLEEDFTDEEKYSRNDLAVYPYEAVLEFISESVKVYLKELHTLQVGNAGMDPTVYYVLKKEEK